MAKSAPIVEEQVTCFVSGESIPKSKAVLVKIGPGQRVWMRHEFTQDSKRGLPDQSPYTGRGGFPRKPTSS